MAVLASYKTHTNPGESLFRFINPNTYQGAAQPFSHALGSSHTLTSIMMELKKTGTPTQANLFRIRTDSAGAPGSVLTTGSIAGSAISSAGYVEYTVSAFDTAINLASGTTYWCAWETSADGTDDTNYYQWGIGNSAIVYTAEQYKLNGSYNVETGFNCYFEIQGNPVGGAGAKHLPYLNLLGVGS